MVREWRPPIVSAQEVRVHATRTGGRGEAHGANQEVILNRGLRSSKEPSFFSLIRVVFVFEFILLRSKSSV